MKNISGPQVTLPGFYFSAMRQTLIFRPFILLSCISKSVELTAPYKQRCVIRDGVLSLIFRAISAHGSLTYLVLI